MIKFPPKKAHSFAYSKKHIRSRLLRSSFGVAIIVAVVFGLPALWWLDVIFGFIGALFALYLYQTLQQMRHAVVADKEGLSFGKKRLAWSDIQALKLRHYGGGSQTISLGVSFFELTLRGENSKISLDSEIGDFKDLLSLVVGATHALDIKVDESTAHNIGYLLKEE